jgi:hypothetical protein
MYGNSGPAISGAGRNWRNAALYTLTGGFLLYANARFQANVRLVG